MRSRTFASTLLRWALVCTLVVPVVSPAMASADDPAYVAPSPLQAASDEVSDETSPSAEVTESVETTPLGAIPMDGTGTWTGLKGRTSDVRLVPFDPGIARGKSLIVIQVEALQASLINRKANGVYVTPRLNSLVNSEKGTFYFPHTCAQIARGNTSDAEWSANSSLYPPINQASCLRWGDKSVPSLPRELRQEGYYTATFHGNEARFWNRKKLYAALGFNRYYDRSFFGNEEFWKWGVSDKVLFSKTLSLLRSWRADHRKFYAQVVTLSSHGPFDATVKRPWNPSGVYRGTRTGAYLSAESYADQQIGVFVQNLKKYGLWDDCVVVIYGDHFGQLKATDSAERAAQERFYGRKMRSTDRLFVPMIVHVPGVTGRGVINDTCGQMDLLPTMSDAMGFNISDKRYFGRDVFTASRAAVGLRGIMPTGSYVDNRIIATPGSFRGLGVVQLSNWKTRVPSPLDQRVHADVLRAMASSLRYTDHLPKRYPGCTKRDADAFIPTEPH